MLQTSYIEIKDGKGEIFNLLFTLFLILHIRKIESVSNIPLFGGYDLT